MMHLWYYEAVTISTWATIGLNMKNVKNVNFSDGGQGSCLGK